MKIPISAKLYTGISIFSPYVGDQTKYIVLLPETMVNAKDLIAPYGLLWFPPCEVAKFGYIILLKEGFLEYPEIYDLWDDKDLIKWEKMTLSIEFGKIALKFENKNEVLIESL